MFLNGNILFLLCSAMSIGRILGQVFLLGWIIERGRASGFPKEKRAALAALLPLTDGKIRCRGPEQGQSWDEAKTVECCGLQSHYPQIVRCG